MASKANIGGKIAVIGTLVVVGAIATSALHGPGHHSAEKATACGRKAVLNLEVTGAASDLRRPTFSLTYTVGSQPYVENGKSPFLTTSGDAFTWTRSFGWRYCEPYSLVADLGYRPRQPFTCIARATTQAGTPTVIGSNTSRERTVKCPAPVPPKHQPS